MCPECSDVLGLWHGCLTNSTMRLSSTGWGPHGRPVRVTYTLHAERERFTITPKTGSLFTTGCGSTVLVSSS